MISEAVTVPVRIEATTRRISDQWARMSATLMRPAISGSSVGIGGRLAEAVEPPVLQVRNARRELEAEQGAERKDMVGIAAAIGVVAAGRDLALVIEQRVEHMQRLACRRRDHLGVERRVAVGEVGVELEPGLIAVMGVEAAGVTAEAAGLEELAVRGRGQAAAEDRRERLALLLVDQAPQRQGIGLLADVPVGGPGELAEAGDAARLGHARQAEIEPVGEQARHQDAAVGRGLAGAQMGEAVGEQRPARHFGQQVGDADARQHGVEPRGQGLGLRRRRFLDRRDLQHALVERDVRQQAALRLGVDRRQPLVQQRAAAGDEALEVGIDRGGARVSNAPIADLPALTPERGGLTLKRPSRAAAGRVAEEAVIPIKLLVMVADRLTSVRLAAAKFRFAPARFL